MARNKYTLAGGSIQTIKPKCGYRVSGNPRDVNFIFKLHQKRCESCRTNIKLENRVLC